MSDDDTIGDWNQVTAGFAFGRLQQAKSSLDGGEYLSATIQLEELLTNRPNSPDALSMLGDALFNLSDPGGACLAYQQHLELVPPSADSLSGYSAALFESADIELSLKKALAAIALDPSCARAHFYASVSLEHQGDIETSVKHQMIATDLFPLIYPKPLNISDSDWKQVIASAFLKLEPEQAETLSSLEPVLEGLPLLAHLRATDPPINPMVPGLLLEPDDEKISYERKNEEMQLVFYRQNLARAGCIDDAELAILAVLSQAVRSLSA